MTDSYVCLGTVQGVLQAPPQSLQTIQLQVVDAPAKQVTRVKAVDQDNWKFIQVTPDGQTTTYIQK